MSFENGSLTSAIVELEITKEKETSTNLIEDTKTQSQWTPLLTFTGFASTLGTKAIVGYSVSAINSPEAIISSWCNETLIARYDWHLSSAEIDFLWSAVVSILMIGGIVGGLSGAWTADKFGRRGAIFAGVIFILIASVLFYCCRLSSSVEMLLIGRFVMGLAAGLMSACLPMYLCELAPLALRGTVAVLCPLSLTVGVLLGQILTLEYIFGNDKLWHVALSFPGLITLLCFTPFFLYPESPTWLYIVKGDKEAAIRQLQKLRGNIEITTIAKEIAEMEAEANVREQASSFGEVLRDSKLLLPIVLVCAYTGGAQFSGANAIFFYSVSIFEKAGLSAQISEWANISAGTINLAVALFQPLLMAKVNRRPLMLFSTFFCAFFMLTYLLMLYFIESVAWFAWGCIICIYLYLISFQLGFSPISYFIGAELVEAAPRPVIMALGALASWFAVFIVGIAFPSLQNLWGPLVFLPFSINSAIVFLLSIFYLPETRGRDPSEVAPRVANGFKSKVL